MSKAIAPTSTVCALALLASCFALPAATLTVTSLNDNGPGTLRQAILAASPNDTINFAVTGTITLTNGQLTITTNLTISGPGPTNLIVSGNYANRVFSTLGGNIVIDGVTIANGTEIYSSDPNVQGGGIKNTAFLTITDSILSDNSASGDSGGSGTGYGGAIYNTGTLVVRNCTVVRNAVGRARSGSSNQGGAIYNTGALTVSGTTFFSNSVVSSGIGGGIWNSGPMNITDSAFYSNTGNSWGSAIHNEVSGVMLLADSIVATNTANGGSAVVNFGAGNISHCLITSNIAFADSGGIWNFGTLTVSNTDVSLNYANDGYGGGIGNMGGTLTVEGCRIAQNVINGGHFGSQGQGGGIGSLAGVVVINNSLICSNVAHDGGGVSSEGMSMTINNSTICDNVASYFGGGIINHSASSSTTNAFMFMTNSTLSRNSAGAYPSAGGIDNTAEANLHYNVIANLVNCTVVSNVFLANHEPWASGIFVGNFTATNLANVNLHSTLVANNSAAFAPAPQALQYNGGTITSLGYNLCSDASANLAQPTDKPITEPRLGPLQDNGGPTWTHALLPGSPAIDAGHSGGLRTDQRGGVRPYVKPGNTNALPGDGSDIGAIESGGYLRLTSLAKTNSDIRIQFTTDLGHDYHVERRGALGTNAWAPLPGIVPGTGGVAPYVDTNAALLPSGFYRVGAD